MIDTIKEPKRETRKAPPKKWRNWYFIPRPTLCTEGVVIGPGKVGSDRVWPSKEVAEAMAAKALFAPGFEWARHGAEYLGAEPEE